MNDMESATVVAEIAKRWPRIAARKKKLPDGSMQEIPGEWASDVVGDIKTALKPLNITTEQAIAIVREVNRTKAGSVPRPAWFIPMWRDADRQGKAATKQASAPPPTWQSDRLRTMRGHMNDHDGPPLRVVCSWYRDAAERSMRLRGYVRESWLTNAVDELQSVGCVTLSQAEAWAGRVYAEYPHKAPAVKERTAMQIKFAAMEAGEPVHFASLSARAAGGGE